MNLSEHHALVHPDLDVEVLAPGFGLDGSAEGSLGAVGSREDALVLQPVRNSLD